MDLSGSLSVDPTATLCTLFVAGLVSEELKHSSEKIVSPDLRIKLGGGGLWQPLRAEGLWTIEETDRHIDDIHDHARLHILENKVV